jgi:glutamate synthase (NADPH/NADH) large chain
VADAGMGDLLEFDADRLRILVERHLLHTASARAKDILDNWDASLSKFVKVMPLDYAKALTDMKARSAMAAE